MTPRSPLPERGGPPYPATSTLVLNRRIGEEFSLGEDWRFVVLGLTAQLASLAATDRLRTTRWQLEVDDALQITDANTLVCRRHSRDELAPLDIRVARVTTGHASLLIHVPRSLKITRHEPTPPHGNPV